MISACLVGKNVKYDGKNNSIDLSELEKRYELVPFCPEVEGGLPTPRSPSEIVSFEPLQLINKDGVDVTKEFVKGAKKCADLVKKEGIKKAILKSKSPSCGEGKVYDGTFSKKLISGDGVSVQELKKIGVKIYDELSLPL